MPIFAAFPREVMSNDSGVGKTAIFRAVGRYVFGKFRNKANIMILCYNTIPYNTKHL